MVLQIVFRTDASPTIGTGHVMRCLTLAGALVEKGAKISFICREHAGHLCDLIAARGFRVHRLPAPDRDFEAGATPTHAAWLGATWQEDADQTSAVIKTPGARPDYWTT